MKNKIEVKKSSGKAPVSEFQGRLAKKENEANTRPGRVWRPIGYSKVKSKIVNNPDVSPNVVPANTGHFGSGEGYNDPTGKKLAGSKGYTKVG